MSGFRAPRGYGESSAFSALSNNLTSLSIQGGHSTQYLPPYGHYNQAYQIGSSNTNSREVTDQSMGAKTLADTGSVTQTLATTSSPLIALPGFLLISDPSSHFRELKELAEDSFIKFQSAVIMEAPNDKTQSYLDSGRSGIVLKTFIQSEESTSAEDSLAAFHSECSLMWAFQSNPHVAQLLGYSTSPNMLIMPLYHGHLQSILESKTPTDFPDSALSTAASHIVNAMSMLHETLVAHLDVSEAELIFDGAPPFVDGVFGECVGITALKLL